MNDICYYDEHLKMLRGSRISKARKFVKEKCVVRDDHGFLVKPIKGYNKRTYEVMTIEGQNGLLYCNCQQNTLKKEICSHILAVELFLKQEKEGMDKILPME